MLPENIFDRGSLITAISEGFRPTFLFFWGHQVREDGQIGKECLSQWYPAAFEIDGITYRTAEHYMMAEKARLFGDLESLEEILRAPDPQTAKHLGRGVRNFDKEIWERNCVGIVVRGNIAKFGQNTALRAFLLQTGERILVEASPRDTIWGIGLSADNPCAADPRQWRGTNLLGFALMKARAEISA